MIGRLPASAREECETFKQLVRDILRDHGSEPIELPPNAALQADAPAEVPAALWKVRARSALN